MNKKIIVEQNGEKKEVTSEELQDIKNNPEFLVTELSDTNEETRVNVRQLLID